MKPEELQIGNWVTSKKWIDNPFHLTRINDNGKFYYGVTVNNSQVGPFFIDELYPIPITTEILLKNGFSLLEQTRTYKVFTLREEDELSIQVDFLGKDSRIIVRIEKYNYESKYYMNCLHNCDIKYLHQLQQAMRLCGIDKEITLN